MNKNLLKSLMAVMMLSVSFGAHAIKREQLAEYAKTLKGKSKKELKDAIFNLKKPKTPEYGKGTNSTWEAFWTTDRVVGTTKCVNRYSDLEFFFESSTINPRKSIPGTNIEHSMPKSWWGEGKKPKTMPARDLHHLYPSGKTDNTRKNNHPMAEVTQETGATTTGQFKFGKGMVDNKMTTCWEPNDKYKGDFCRAYMYMATIYQDKTWQNKGLTTLTNDSWKEFKDWAIDLYMRWSRNDRVDDLEIVRNNEVYKIQENRNLFIDYPNLAEYIWGDSVDFDPTTSLTTAEDDPRYLNQVAPAVDAPTINPGSGTYTEPIDVEIKGSSDDVKIYYTIDGTNPTTASTPYTTAIHIDKTTTLKAIAVKGSEVSHTTTAVYTFGTETNSYKFKQLEGEVKEGLNYIIVIDKDGLKAALPMKPRKGQKYGYLPTESVEKSESIVIVKNNKAFYNFESVAGGYKIKDANNNYIYQEDKHASFNVTTDGSQADVWTVTKNTDGTYSIKANDSGNVIMYNTKYKTFANYSTQPKEQSLFPMLYEQITVPDGIETVEVTAEKRVKKGIYNLQGVKMNEGVKLPSGIYIVNGKKIVVR